MHKARSGDIQMKRKTLSGSCALCRCVPQNEFIHISKEKNASQNQCEHLCSSAIFTLSLKYARGVENVYKKKRSGEKIFVKSVFNEDEIRCCAAGCRMDAGNALASL